MSKRKPLCALAVAPYYLDNKRWALSKMTVAKNRQGVFVWINTGVISTAIWRSTITSNAVELSNVFKVPIYDGIKKGDSVTDDELFELQKYGLLDHLKS